MADYNDPSLQLQSDVPWGYAPGQSAAQRMPQFVTPDQQAQIYTPNVPVALQSQQPQSQDGYSPLQDPAYTSAGEIQSRMAAVSQPTAPTGYGGSEALENLAKSHVKWYGDEEHPGSAQAAADAVHRLAQSSAQPQSSKSKWAEMIRQLATGVVVPLATGLLGGPGGRAAAGDLTQKATTYTQQLRNNAIAQQKADTESVRGFTDFLKTADASELKDAGMKIAAEAKDNATFRNQAKDWYWEQWKAAGLQSENARREGEARERISRGFLETEKGKAVGPVAQAHVQLMQKQGVNFQSKADYLDKLGSVVAENAKARNGKYAADAALANAKAQGTSALMSAQTNAYNAVASKSTSGAELNVALVDKAQEDALRATDDAQTKELQQLLSMGDAEHPVTAQRKQDLMNAHMTYRQQLVDRFDELREQAQHPEGLSAGPAKSLPVKPAATKGNPPVKLAQPPEPSNPSNVASPADMAAAGMSKKGATSTQGKPIKKETQAAPKLSAIYSKIDAKPWPVSLKMSIKNKINANPSADNIKAVMEAAGMNTGG